jgi:hypothetical protein
MYQESIKKLVSDQTIANSRLGSDIAWLRRIWLDLAAQVADIDPQYMGLLQV